MTTKQREKNISNAKYFMHEVWVLKNPTDKSIKMMDNDTIIESPTGTSVGIDSFITLLKIWYRAFPYLVYRENNISAHNRDIIIDWEIEGEHLGEFYSISATGKKVNYRGTTKIVFTDGKIIHYHTKTDIKNIILQLTNSSYSPVFDIKNIEVYNLINQILGHQLSYRQIECLALSTLNTSIKDIARLLSIENSTVQTHLKRAFEVIGISNKKMLMEFIIECHAIEIMVRVGLLIIIRIRRNKYFKY
ncbi:MULTISPECIES: ester cyclase [Xenorhabdus]|uniref:ester cyclase n=1 Tax=Xenorhabdus TaxID=626 RepID=UPI000691A4E8|nr:MULTISPECIES: ester cyclase [Xenorhabdus]MBC8944372.1 LuxR family transcriptional regulator [Xenorhabdus indica]MBC8946712.1 LuxR family transcriptional regulator [Xenorhabdus indica]